MNLAISRFTILARGAAAIALIATATGSMAGPILTNVWYEFGFTDTATLATGCDPADPAGPFCIPSSGTPTVFLDAPPWTFSTPEASSLTVTDAFDSGDRFQLFDFGASIGLTSVPATPGAVDCGDDPGVCLVTVGMSTGVFSLGAGAHSITLIPFAAPTGGGAGFLQVTIPEPGSLALAVVALLGVLGLRLRPAQTAAR